jgi:polyphosphate kinase
LLAIAGIYLVRVAVLTLRALTGCSPRPRRRSSSAAALEDVRERAVPLLEKVVVTVDAVNAESLRIEGIVSRFEDVGEPYRQWVSSYARGQLGGAEHREGRT